MEHFASSSYTCPGKVLHDPHAPAGPLVLGNGLLGIYQAPAPGLPAIRQPIHCPGRGPGPGMGRFGLQRGLSRYT